MVNYGMGREPSVVYAMISGTGTSSANLKTSQSDGQWLPLMVDSQGRLETTANLVLSGTEIIINLNHDSDNVLIYGNDGTTDRKVLSDSEGRIETRAIISGSMSVNITQTEDSIVIYGTDGSTNRAALTDSSGRLVTLSIPSGSMTVQESFPSNPIVYNVSATSNDVEYSQALPAKTEKFSVQNRTNFARTKLAFTVGQSATTYLTIPEGASYSEDGISITGKTLYFQVPQVSGTVIEVVAWYE